MENNNNISVIFVYKKEGKIKCLSLKDELNQGKELVKNSWVHVTTIDACVFIENLHNELKIDLEL